MKNCKKIKDLFQRFIRSLKNVRRRVIDTLISIYLDYLFRCLICLYLNHILRAILAYYRFRAFYRSATIIAVYWSYWSYRLKLVSIVMHHFLTALETNEKLPGLIEKLRNLKRRASLERCSKIRITMDKIEKVKKKISSSWKELSQFINKNRRQGLITVKDLELSMMRFEGKKKKPVYDYNKEVSLRELYKKYRNFPLFVVKGFYGLHKGTFFDINKYKKNIEKAKQDLCKVKSSEEEREIQKFLVLNEIAQADLELAILIGHRISLSREVEAEFQVNREFMKCVIEIESILGLRLDIDILLS